MMKKKKIIIYILVIINLFFPLNIYASTNIIDATVKKQELEVECSSHVQDIGWQSFVEEEAVSGTTGLNLQLEALKLQLKNAPEGVSVKYKTYVENYGWQQWAEEGNISGTTGKFLKTYGIRIKLEGTTEYSVQYRVHIQDIGWLNWVENGGIAGKISANKKIEAIELKIIKKENISSQELGVEYYTVLQGLSTNEDKIEQNGEMSGTTGEKRSVNGINIELINAPENTHIKYMVHVQDIGWIDWVKNGETAGALNKGLKIEAIKIQLEGLDSYTVEYRAHVQDYGWQDWRTDGKTAGTTGKNLRLEAIEIRIVPHYDNYQIGIDVSRWQGIIDYDKIIKNSEIDFIIPRIGWYSKNQSKFIEDIQFTRNYSQAKNRGIEIGGYIYSYATTIEEIEQEARETVNYLKSTGQIDFDLPIFLDIEDDTQISLGKQKTSEMVIAFGEIIKQAGFSSGVYSYSYFLFNYMDLNMIPSDYEIWVADYGKNNDGQLPSDIYKYSKYNMWQYSDKGVIEGIEGNVDVNIRYY